MQVLNEPGRTATQKSYMWMYSSGRGSPPVIVYNYQTTRASKHPVRFLTGYSGLLQIDGYQGYNKLPASIELAGCFAHARRKYTDILKSLPKNTNTNDSLAEKAIATIGKLYAIERQLKEKYEGKQLDALALNDIYQTRQKHSKPICDEYFSWCRQNKNKTGGSLENKLKIFDYLVYLFEQLAANRHNLDTFDLEPLMPWSDQLPENLRVSK